MKLTKKEVLKKSNQLISVLPKESISLIQQKTFNVFLKIAQSEIMRNQKEYQDIVEEERYLFRIPCNNLIKRAGLGEKNYKKIEKELKKLVQILVEVVEKENKDNWSAFSLLESVRKENNKFIFSLNWMIIKAIKEYNFFTKLDLIQISKLSSKYSVKLYELAKRYFEEQNQNIKIPKMTIKELRQRTGTLDKYKRTNDLLRFAIDPACEEISEKTDITLTYNKIKEGRRIAYIDFSVKKKQNLIQSNKSENNNQQNSLKSAESAQKREKHKLDKLYHLLPEEEQIKSNKETLYKLLQNYKFKYIKADIRYAKKYADKNFMGFLVDSCKNGHFGKAMLEKEEKKKEQARRKREEEKKKKKAKEQRQKAIEEIVATKCENLAEEERKKLKQRYDYLKNTDKHKIKFEDKTDKIWAESHSFEEFLIKHFKAEAKELI